MSSRRCAVSGCVKGAVGASTKSFFRVSGKHRNFDVWKSFCENDAVTKNSFICSDHFVDTDFINNRNYSQGLKPHAVPIRKGALNSAESSNDVSMDEEHDDFRECEMDVCALEEVYDFDLDNVAGEIVVDDDKETFNFPCKKRKLHVDTSAVEHDHDYFFNWSEYMKMKQKINDLQQENSKLKLDLRKKASLLIKKNNIIRRLRANYRQRPTTSQVSVLRDPLLVELQKNKDRKLKGARYTDKMRNMALVVNYCSPKAYRQMRTFFRLPSVSTMKKWLSKIEIKDGFSENILKLLKIKSETLPEDERVVTLFLDEMAITEKVSYVANADLPGQVRRDCCWLTVNVSVLVCVYCTNNSQQRAPNFLRKLVHLYCSYFVFAISAAKSVGRRGTGSQSLQPTMVA
ncbi:uncharacterized protein LOC134285627 [Aedes albopictus]|uniref:THAP-type domain-containing protein n=1 Tax=Aedes albopictus TaxID=7160 RepID=A0ABM1XS61_AEDAL